MIISPYLQFKKTLLWCLVMLLSLLATYLAFISLFSVWIGIDRLHQPGFWVPITAGIVLFIAVSTIFLRTVNRIFGLISNIKDKNILTNQ